MDGSIDSYTKKLIRKFSNFKFIRIFGMGGSSLGANAIYDFLKYKIKVWSHEF